MHSEYGTNRWNVNDEKYICFSSRCMVGSAFEINPWDFSSRAKMALQLPANQFALNLGLLKLSHIISVQHVVQFRFFWLLAAILCLNIYLFWRWIRPILLHDRKKKSNQSCKPRSPSCCCPQIYSVLLRMRSSQFSKWRRRIVAIHESGGATSAGGGQRCNWIRCRWCRGGC